MCKQVGFTLVEVLVAMAITAIAAVMAYSGLDSAIQLAESAEIEAERLQKINRAFDVMANDFRQVIPRMVRSPDGFEQESAFLFDEAAYPMLQLSRSGWINPIPERFKRSELQRVAYHYDGEKLIRYSWQMMDRYDDSELSEVTLINEVEAFSVTLMTVAPNDQNDKIVQAKWENRWPVDASVTADDLLPAAIELQLSIKGWGDIRRVFEFVADGQ